MTEQDHAQGNHRAGAAPAAAWAAARTIADLGELTAQWLEGAVSQHPCKQPADQSCEASGWAVVLAGANRTGFVTEMSQEADGGTRTARRAAVSGYLPVDNDMMQSLARSATANGLWMAVRPPVAHPSPGDLLVIGESGDPDGIILVTAGQGQPRIEFGHARTVRSLQASYGTWCDQSAVDALAECWQVTLVDPVWGRDTLLWPVLAASWKSSPRTPWRRRA